LFHTSRKFIGIYPKPLLEPTISADIVHIKAIPTPTLRPEIIYGIAEGKITLLSTFQLFAPKVWRIQSILYPFF